MNNFDSFSKPFPFKWRFKWSYRKVQCWDDYSESNQNLNQCNGVVQYKFTCMGEIPEKYKTLSVLIEKVRRIGKNSAETLKTIS